MALGPVMVTFPPTSSLQVNPPMFVQERERQRETPVSRTQATRDLAWMETDKRLGQADAMLCVPLFAAINITNNVQGTRTREPKTFHSGRLSTGMSTEHLRNIYRY